MLTSILDLPTELILEIIHSINSRYYATTIACLGMTCRRLHDICQVLVLECQLPVLRALVSRRRLFIYKNPGSIAMEEEELDDVQEILQASFHKIEYVPVTFTVEENASVQRLIFHASAVGHINIILDSPLYMFSQAEKKDWHKPLASLISVSSEKDMASLSITGIPYGELQYFTPKLPIPKTPSSPVKDYFSIFSALKDRFFDHTKRRSGAIGTQPDRAAERERLTKTGVYFGPPQGLKTFEINSPIPFHGACFPHTLRVLNGGYLTKLSLCNTRLRMQDWGNILPLLSMPLLSEFIVEDAGIAFRDLSPFLRRHSSITHLDLSCSLPIGTITPPKGFLPRLEVISGNPGYLLGLLSRQRHLFPHLRPVALTPYQLPVIQYGELDNVLRNLADRKRGTIHLSIEFLQPTGLTDWFTKAKAKSKSLSLDCVKTLEILILEFRISLHMCDSFFSWVSVKFPYVQELDLTWAVPEDLNMRIWRLDALWDSCSELRSIIVGEKTYQRPVKAVE